MYSQEQAKGSGYPCIAVFDCFYCVYLIKKKSENIHTFFQKNVVYFRFCKFSRDAYPRIPQSWSAGTAEVSYRIFSESRK